MNKSSILIHKNNISQNLAGLLKTKLMITFNEALKTVKYATKKLPKEHIELSICLNRILAEDVISPIAIPSFNKSAMDGFACRQQDLSETLKIIETISAGTAPTKTIGEKQCSRVMNGAMIPEGADCVITVEHSKIVEEKHIRFTKSKTKTNIYIKR